MQGKNSTNVKFSARLQTAAAAKGLDQTSLARQTGLTNSAINNYWNKGRVPKSEELHRISRALGVTMEFLITGEDPRVGQAASDWRHRALAAEQKLDAVKNELAAFAKKI